MNRNKFGKFCRKEITQTVTLLFSMRGKWTGNGTRFWRCLANFGPVKGHQLVAGGLTLIYVDPIPDPELSL